MPNWLWAIRWYIGGRLVSWGAWHVIPRCAARSDLQVHINDWARGAQAHIDEAKRRQLAEEVRGTVDTWQA
jgi:hypothetical protein